MPSLWWAGLLTVGLVWLSGASSLPDGLAWIDERLVIHISAAIFLVLGLGLNLLNSDRMKAVFIALQAVCAAAFIAVDESSSGPILNIVLVSQLPYVLGIRPAVVIAIGLNVVHLLILLFIRGASPLEAFLTMALFACFQLFSLAIGHFALKASEARQDLAASNAELLATRSLLESSARDRERLRVSREVHDTAGHTLTALKLNLRQLRDEARPEDREALADCLELSAELLEDIRSLVGNLREQAPLDLERALNELTRPFRTPAFAVEVATDVTIDDLAVARSLLAVAREAVTNVVRHAQAQHCVIRVERAGDGIRLTVTDDGVGAQGPEGIGIRGMRERMSSARGVLEITPNLPSGTRVAAAWSAP